MRWASVSAECCWCGADRGTRRASVVSHVAGAVAEARTPDHRVLDSLVALQQHAANSSCCRSHTCCCGCRPVSYHTAAAAGPPGRRHSCRPATAGAACRIRHSKTNAQNQAGGGKRPAHTTHTLPPVPEPHSSLPSPRHCLPVPTHPAALEPETPPLSAPAALQSSCEQQPGRLPETPSATSAPPTAPACFLRPAAR